MVRELVSSTSFPLLLILQSTACLALGLLASIIWSRRPARAHRLLLLAIAAGTITPLLSLAVRQMNWGLLPNASTQAAARVPPDLHGLTANSSTMDHEIAGSAIHDPAKPPTVEPAANTVSVAAGVPNEPVWSGSLVSVSGPVLLAIAWAMLSAMVGIRLLVSLIAARRILASARTVPDGPLRRTLGEAAAALGLSVPAVLRASSAVRLPIIWCWGRRPVVVLPQSESVNLADIDWLGIFCHELAHWRRRDHLSGLFGELLVAALPWHPLAWWARQRLIQLSEQACDDWVLTGKRSRGDYAESLLSLRLQDRPILALTVLSSRQGLARRIRRILAPRRSSPHVGRSWSIRAASVTLLLAVAAATAQTRSGAAGADQKEPEQARLKASVPTMVVTGRVVDSQGHPLSNAQVAVVGRSRRPHRGGDLSAERPERLGMTTAGTDGRFRLNMPRISSTTFFSLHILAAAGGHGMGVEPLNVDAGQADVEVQLPPEQIVRGRLLDDQGRPAAGVTVHVAWLGKLLNGDVTGVQFWDPPEGLPIWPEPVVTNEDGRFLLRGLNRDAGLKLQVRDEHFAREFLEIDLMAAGSPQEVTISLKPSKIIEGRVLYGDTGEPVPNARLTVYAGDEEMGSRRGISGRADSLGRFRVSPFPGRFFEVCAYPPEGQPYLIRRETISWPPQANKADLDVTLPRGALVVGKVTEEGSGEPVAGAAVQYLAGSATQRKWPEGIVTGWQAMVVTGPDGAFKIAVPPGSGHLLVHGPTSDYILEEIGSSEIFEGQSGGWRYYAHAFVPLDTEANTDLTPLSVSLRRGVTVNGRLVGPGGEPVSKARILRRFQASASSVSWRDEPLEILGDRFQLDGLDPQETYRVLFLDSENQWGTVAEISGSQAGSEAVTVQLKPCGSAVARFVAPDGKPFSGEFDRIASLKIVVTPGVSIFDWQAGRRREELVANEAFLANFDRRHHWEAPIPDEQGRCTFAALVPGATHKFYFPGEEDDVQALSFTVAPGETKLLPDIVLRDRQ